MKLLVVSCWLLVAAVVAAAAAARKSPSVSVIQEADGTEIPISNCDEGAKVLYCLQIWSPEGARPEVGPKSGIP